MSEQVLEQVRFTKGGMTYCRKENVCKKNNR